MTSRVGIASLIACGLLVAACGSDEADSNNGSPDAGQDVVQGDVQADTPSTTRLLKQVRMSQTKPALAPTSRR